MIKNQKILITGATGFIGSKTAKKLSELGYQIVSFKGDVGSVEDWINNLNGGEIVFHIAGVRTESEKDFEVNTKGVENLFLAIERSKKIPKKIILVSSQAVYFGCEIPFNEEMRLNPTSVYGKSKLKAEEIAQKESKKLKIPLVILRYSTVLGRGVRENSNMSGPLASWTASGLKGYPINVFQDGNQTRDYIHISDIVSANIIAVENIKSGVFNVGGGKEIRLKDLAELVKFATGNKSKITIAGGGPTKEDPKRLLSNIEKLKKYGWKPEKSVKEAVNDYVRETSLAG
ncbi:MAG: NAD-dependent epimerase/dehydratase family protein [Candidatus Levybacteria bacterium]|nr:NAD-dependent epimerase/dehydratase family protein [Candidatus Levybacteria bacterium]